MKNKKLYFVDGIFSGTIEAESEEDARVDFTELDIDNLNIVSVVPDDEDEIEEE